LPFHVVFGNDETGLALDQRDKGAVADDLPRRDRRAVDQPLLRRQRFQSFGGGAT
jgi:hypothetical protein